MRCATKYLETKKRGRGGERRKWRVEGRGGGWRVEMRRWR